MYGVKEFFKVFNGVRWDVMKVLVVIIDKKLDSLVEDVKKFV